MPSIREPFSFQGRTTRANPGRLGRFWLPLMISLSVCTQAVGQDNNSPGSSNTVTMINQAGGSVSVNSNGVYRVQFDSPPWTFGGNLRPPLENVATNGGADQLGAYLEIRFGYRTGVGHAAAIRLYQDRPVVVFSDTTLAASPNDLSFPRLSTYPGNLKHLSYGKTFGVYNFNTLFGDSPWVFFDTNCNAFILSPATNFLVASNGLAGDGSISCGLDSAITQLPAHFTHRTLLTAGCGIGRTITAWGAALSGLCGAARPANDAGLELDSLGYWTDNGAAYYYKYDAAKGYAGTLLAIRDEFANKGVPLGYMQLDSWWYPKGASASWQGDPTNSRGGTYLYRAAAPLFPDGLASFQKDLGLPVVTHARWIDPASPYRAQYAMSRDVCIDPAYWSNVMAYIKGAGAVTYEQDWLSLNGVPLMNLHDPPAFMDSMQAAAAANGLNLQYCMPWARHYLQGVLYPNLLTIRTSNDHLTTREWDQFIYDSQLAWALGEWPWCDVFMSAETRNVLIATLSAGPVGPGDVLGSVHAANLLKAVRPDSVIVKPDTSLVPLDQTYVDDVLRRNLPMLAAARTDHGTMRACYVFAYARSSGNRGAAFSPESLGISNNAYVYDYFSGTGAVVSNGSGFHFTADLPEATGGGNYFVVVPIGPSGIGFLGDTNKFVTLGRKRISALSDAGFLRATVEFAAGETNVSLSGYSLSPPFVRALEGTIRFARYDAVHRYFIVGVSPGASGSATIALSRRPLPALQKTNTPG